MVLAPAVAGQRLRFLPSLRENGRRLLPRLPVALARGGFLSLCAPTANLADADLVVDARLSDVRAEPVPLSDATRPAQLSDECAGDNLEHPLDVDSGRDAVRGYGRGAAARRMVTLVHSGFAGVSDLLSAGV